MILKGKIVKQISNQYDVLLEDGNIITARAKGKLRHMKLDQDSPFYKSVSSRSKKETVHMQINPKVGDHVVLYKDQEIYVMDEILPRKNDLFRPDIANIDQVLLVFSATMPDFNVKLLNKFLTILSFYHVDIYIILTKTDLLTMDEKKPIKEILNYYDSIGYPHIEINVKDLSDVSKIDDLMDSKVTVVSGQTGVGKSTLLNHLMPHLNIQTQEISLALGRGKHTTRHTELYPYKGGLIADTPGFSKLSFELIKKETLKEGFTEFSQYPCKFSSCDHIKEPFCGVKEAVTQGQILESRYQDYLSFYQEIEEIKIKY
jgi:ribosome biogenesis GTPase / thiamine phosphate phosphatase